MNKMISILACVIVAFFTACTDAKSENVGGATTEPNNYAKDDSRDSAAVWRNACDSVLNGLAGSQGQNMDSAGTINPATSSSMTTYDFTTAQERFYEENGCFVSIYECESGVRYLPSRSDGHFEMISLVYPDEEIVLRLLNNSYWSGSCDSDLENFHAECERENGVFMDYKNGNGCSQNQKIEAACAVHVSEETLYGNLEKEAIRYREDCVNYTSNNSSESPCSITCRIDTDMESHCDTTCNEE